MGSKVTINEIENLGNLCFDRSIENQCPDGYLYLRWLGQAGFYIGYNGNFLMIDPYLSDFLAEKYKGKEFPHIRMMPIPVHPSEITEVDFIFCTHGHSDHMDPGTLPLLAQKDSGRKFVVPKAEKIKAMERGIPERQMILVNDGDSLSLNVNVKLDVIPSAHEKLDKNENSEYYYLGYILTIGPYKIYHSGDCVPYPGLAEKLKRSAIDIALLPVNGRDEYRQERGVPGNFTLNEAIELCRESNIPNLIVHHFGMFFFNTVSSDFLEQTVETAKNESLNIVIPNQSMVYNIHKNICND